MALPKLPPTSPSLISTTPNTFPTLPQPRYRQLLQLFKAQLTARLSWLSLNSQLLNRAHYFALTMLSVQTFIIVCNTQDYNYMFPNLSLPRIWEFLYGTDDIYLSFNPQWANGSVQTYLWNK